MKRVNWRSIFAAGLLGLLSESTLASTMTIQWTDPIGDFGPVGDVVSAQLTFDSTGAWTATWYADAANPFTGNARFNLNLFDLALGDPATATAPQVSLDGFMDFGASTATVFSYAGVTPYLANWQVGDQVTSGNSVTFLSGAVNLNAPYGRDNLLSVGTITASVPLPGTLMLLVTGLGLLGTMTTYRQQIKHNAH